MKNTPAKPEKSAAPAQFSPPGTPPSLAARMTALGIREGDLHEEFILGSGAGGQKINKTHSCVRLRHQPSGTEIRCQASRSRGKNRIIARETLCQTFEQERARKHQEKARRQALARNRARNPAPAAKTRRRQDKHRHSEKKSLRKPPSAR